MSARTEELTNRINDLQDFLVESPPGAEQTVSAYAELKRLIEELERANKTLSEGVLRG